MPNITHLNTLLNSLSPVLQPEEYVFCSVENLDFIDPKQVIMLFHEAEAITVILEKSKAIALNMPFESTFAWITLQVNSSLLAVGLTATFSKILADNNLSCNVVAGYNHDHIFVEYHNRNKALNALKLIKAG